MSIEWVLFSFVPFAGRKNRCHHFVEGLVARGHRVLWFDPPTLRLRGKPDGEFEEVAPGVWRGGFPNYAMMSPLGQGRWRRAVRPQLEDWRTPGAPLVVLLQVPTLHMAALFLRADLVVYDAVDAWRHHEQGEARVATETAESVLAQRAGMVVGASELSCERFRAAGVETHLLPNGCRPEDWAGLEALAVDPAVAGKPSPRFLYMGGIDDHFDVVGLAAAARSLPGASFLLVGPCGQEGVRAALEKLENVHLLGQRPYAELPALIAGADVGLLPLLVNRFNRARDNLKLYEYLAAGLPVASNALPCADRFGDLVRQADPEAGGFAVACAQALQDCTTPRRDERLEFARANTWATRVDRLEQVVSARLELARAKE